MSIVGFDQLFDNGQSYSGTSMFAGARLLAPVKTLEEKGKVLFSEFPTGVGKHYPEFSW